MRLYISIELGNEAMQTLTDASVAITKATLRHGDAELVAGDSGALRDINGNTVGKWEVIE